MNSKNLYPLIAAVILAPSVLNPVYAASPKKRSTPKIQKVTYTFGSIEMIFKKGSEKTSLAHGIMINAGDTYRIDADHATVDGAISNILNNTIHIEGNSQTGDQIHLVFKIQLEGQKIEMYSDHLLVTPEKSRVNGQDLHFTGNVKMVTHYPGALEQESVTSMEDATLQLGVGDEYPKLIAHSVNGSAVPKQ